MNIDQTDISNIKQNNIYNISFACFILKICLEMKFQQWTDVSKTMRKKIYKKILKQQFYTETNNKINRCLTF